MTEPNFAVGSVTARLIERLASMQVNEEILWSELNEVAGTNVQHGGYHHLHSAFRILARDEIFFRSLRGIGYRCLDNLGKAEGVGNRVRRMRGQAKQARIIGQAVDIPTLEPEMRVMTVARMTVAMVAEEAATPKQVKKLAGKFTQNVIEGISPRELFEGARKAMKEEV